MSDYITGHKSDILRRALACAVNDRIAYLEGLKEGREACDDQEWIEQLMLETRAEIEDFQRLAREYY